MQTAAEQLNQELISFYQSKWDELEKIQIMNQELSAPLFVSVPEKYPSLKTKLMVVGQQTWDWGIENGRRKDLGSNPIKTLMEWAHGFPNHYKRSPFFQAASKLCRMLNGDDPEAVFLWSNLVRVDQHNKRPSTEIEEEMADLKLLEEEIKITNPDVIVFFTGPNYDDTLEKTFPDMVKTLKDNYLSILDHSLLPKFSFRTYHPGYLRRKRMWNYLSIIADEVNNNY